MKNMRQHNVKEFRKLKMWVQLGGLPKFKVLIPILNILNIHHNNKTTIDRYRYKESDS